MVEISVMWLGNLLSSQLATYLPFGMRPLRHTQTCEVRVRKLSKAHKCSSGLARW